MKEADTATQYVTDDKGHKIAVIISVVDYQSMVEDLHDFSMIEKRKKESTISLESMKHKIKK